jgi:hypothetical protein
MRVSKIAKARHDFTAALVLAARLRMDLRDKILIIVPISFGMLSRPCPLQ